MFFYKKNNIFIFVPLKCGFSTFENLRQNKIIEKFEVFPSANNAIIYFICRDPYARLESFYKDKVINNIDGIKQKSQKHLLNFFSNKDLQSHITFEQFIIEGLGKGYMDDHIQPQSFWVQYDSGKYYMTLTQGLRGLMHHVLKLETDMEILDEVLGIDVNSYRLNTSINQISLEWTKEMRNIVNTIYSEDFSTFNYEKK